MRKILIFIVLILIFNISVNADDGYLSQYENIDIGQLENGMDEQTQEFFAKNNIDAKNPEWVNGLTGSSVLQHILCLVTGGMKTPVKVGTFIAGIIFLLASFTAFGSLKFETSAYAATLAASVFVGVNIWQSVEIAINAVKGCCSFMASFVPIFASVLALSGKTVTAPAMSSLLLGAGEAISFASSFIVLPLMGGYLALSMASGVSPLLNNSGIVEGVKKLSMWIMSLLGTVFVGVLGIQTAVNSAADSVALRTAKFLLGTSVPVAGGVLSEAVSTISASMGLLRSSIGIYGVVALVVMLLPIIVELVLWRFVLIVNISLSRLFQTNKMTDILCAVDSMLSVLLGVVFIVGAMFIISLSITVSAGKT